MSTARYCDIQAAPDCPSRKPYNGVFSELSDDWTTLSGTQMRRNQDGKRIQVEVGQDSCGPCSLFRMGQHPSQVARARNDYQAQLEADTHRPMSDVIAEAEANV